MVIYGSKTLNILYVFMVFINFKSNQHDQTDFIVKPTAEHFAVGSI